MQNSEKLENQLLCIHEYEQLPQYITKLETQGLTTIEQMEIINYFKETFTGYAKDQLELSLKKNPDLDKFLENQDYEHRKNTKFAPLTSVDVERSFSDLKLILTDRRTGFKEDNLCMYLVVHFNSHLNENYKINDLELLEIL